MYIHTRTYTYRYYPSYFCLLHLITMSTKSRYADAIAKTIGVPVTEIKEGPDSNDLDAQALWCF